MDASLAEALAPVLRDLEGSGSMVPDVRDEQWSGVDGQATAMLYSADGSGQGVSAVITEPSAQRIASVADQVQEWAVEELCSIDRPATWPRVPAASRFPSPVSSSAGESPYLELSRDRPRGERDRAAARFAVIAPRRPRRARRRGELAGLEWADDAVVAAVGRRAQARDDARCGGLDPTAKDKRQTREALLRSIASQADGRMALKLAGCLRELNPTAADRRRAREVLLELLDDQVDGQLARDLAGMVMQLAVTGEDRCHARGVMLCLLDGQIGSSPAPDLLSWAVQLAVSAKDKNDTCKALLRRLPAGPSPRQTGDVVAAVVQLATTSKGKRQARQAFLSTLAQADGWTAVELIAGLIQLSPGPREKSQARNTILTLLASPTSWPLAARLLDGLAQLDPAARDIRTWHAWELSPTAELLAMVRGNSELTEWLAALPTLAPPPPQGGC